MKNEVLMTLNLELDQAMSLLKSAEQDLETSRKVFSRAEYELSLREIGETEYGHYENERDEAMWKFQKFLSKRDQALAELHIVCGEIKQYAINVCVPEEFRETAVANFDTSRDYVRLRFTIGEKPDEDEITSILIINGLHCMLSF